MNRRFRESAVKRYNSADTVGGQSMAYREANEMNAEPELRFQGVVDHVAIKCDDLKQSVTDYQQMGFRLETLYDDWAMMRDVRGFGIALLPPGSHHPQHIGLKVDSLEALRAAAEKEGRPIKEHRDKTISFYTKGTTGQAIELIYYPPEYGGK